MTPLADAINAWVKGRIEAAAGAPLLMISGAQGIGKSSGLALVQSDARFNVAVIGLDDVYKTKAARRAMARDVHPLCETRGPPGSHDLALLGETLDRLRAAAPDAKTPIPQFDKKVDDRAPESQWPEFAGAPDAIIVEGWLVGVLPDEGAPDAAPVNALEANADSDGSWRRLQEAALTEAYLPLWRRADAVLHLLAPSFDIVKDWRLQQEETTFGVPPGALPEDRKAWVLDFIQYYERLTRRILAGGRVAGDVIRVDEARRVIDEAGGG